MWPSESPKGIALTATPSHRVPDSRPRQGLSSVRGERAKRGAPGSLRASRRRCRSRLRPALPLIGSRGAAPIPTGDPQGAALNGPPPTVSVPLGPRKSGMDHAPAAGLQIIARG